MNDSPIKTETPSDRMRCQEDRPLAPTKRMFDIIPEVGHGAQVQGLRRIDGARASRALKAAIRDMKMLRAELCDTTGSERPLQFLLIRCDEHF